MCTEMSFEMKRNCTDLVSGNDESKKTPTHADSCTTFCSSLVNPYYYRRNQKKSNNINMEIEF